MSGLWLAVLVILAHEAGRYSLGRPAQPNGYVSVVCLVLAIGIIVGTLGVV